MKFSENWLRSLVDIRADSATLARRLTMGGLEVAEVAPIGDSLDGVVVARIVSCAPHPDADKLRVCRVDTGTGEVQIVCGAPNAREGLVAPLATVGATLPNGVTIKTAKLRGVESQGMLCSAKELGIDADASGLMELPANAPVGKSLAEYLGLPDVSIEVELTPNRGDCLGMLGLADEVAAEFGLRAKPFEAPPVPAAVSAPREIRLEAGADCPRYLGRAVRGIDMAATTPAWMAQRLRAAGVKPINAVVDVTNYVMLETGQPLHAFDEAKLVDGIVVRRAHKGETLKLLDGSDATVDPSFLLIADNTKPLAVAGVMGGFDSRVTGTTCDVFLEAAHFSPAAVMGRARKLGLTTDAAHRFERGVDPELPRAAMERATALLIEIAGGQPGEIIEAATPEHLRQPATIALRRARIVRVLGIAIEDAEVERILTALGMHVDAQTDGWRVTPPSRRFDIEREEDLIEEVARIHGYDTIPARLPAGAPPAPRDDESVLPASALAAGLAARDYHEAICYAFIDPRLLQTWQLDAQAVALANPLSADLAVMRTSLLPGLIEALKRNRNRQQTRVRLFESGVVFRRQDPVPRKRRPRRPRCWRRSRAAARMRSSGASPGGRWISSTPRVISNRWSNCPGHRKHGHSTPPICRPGCTPAAARGSCAMVSRWGRSAPCTRPCNGNWTCPKPVFSRSSWRRSGGGPSRPRARCRTSRRCAVTSRSKWTRRSSGRGSPPRFVQVCQQS